MEDSEKREYVGKNAAIWLGIATICYFIAFVYPLLGGDYDTDTIFDVFDLFEELESNLLINVLALGGFIFAFFKLAGEFSEPDEFSDSDCRKVAWGMIPYAVLVFMLYLLLDETEFVKSIAKAFFDVTKEFGIVIIAIVIISCFSTIGSGLHSLSTSTENTPLKVASWGFYGMATFIGIIIGTVYLAMKSDKLDLDEIETIGKIAGILQYISIFCACGGLLVATFNLPGKGEKGADEFSEYEAPQAPESNIDRGSYSSGSAVSGYSENSRPVQTTPPVPSASGLARDVEIPLNNMTLTQLEDVIANASAYDKKYVEDARKELKIRGLVMCSDTELLQMMQHPDGQPYEVLKAVTETLYQRRVPAYINGFKALSDQQLNAIVSNARSYFEADVKTASEELSRRRNANTGY